MIIAKVSTRESWKEKGHLISYQQKGHSSITHSGLIKDENDTGNDFENLFSNYQIIFLIEKNNSPLDIEN